MTASNRPTLAADDEADHRRLLEEARVRHSRSHDQEHETRDELESVLGSGRCTQRTQSDEHGGKCGTPTCCSIPLTNKRHVDSVEFQASPQPCTWAISATLAVSSPSLYSWSPSALQPEGPRQSEEPPSSLHIHTYARTNAHDDPHPRLCSQRTRRFPTSGTLRL